MFPGSRSAPVASGGDQSEHLADRATRRSTDLSAPAIVVEIYLVIGTMGDRDDHQRSAYRAGGERDRRPRGRQLATLLVARIPAIAGVDTRALARRLRTTGCQRAILTEPGSVDAEAAVERARGVARWEDQDFVAALPAAIREVGEPGEGGPLVAIVDYGLKANIVHSLRRRGARVGAAAHGLGGDRPGRRRGRRALAGTATRHGSTGRLRSRARSSTTGDRCWGCSGTRSSDGPRAPRRGGCGSGITGPTTRSRTSTPARSR